MSSFALIADALIGAGVIGFFVVANIIRANAHEVDEMKIAASEHKKHFRHKPFPGKHHDENTPAYFVNRFGDEFTVTDAHGNVIKVFTRDEMLNGNSEHSSSGENTVNTEPGNAVGCGNGI